MAIRIRRREFVAALGGTALVCPLAARVQQSDRMRRIGVVLSLVADDPEDQARVAAAKALGLTVPQTLQVAADEIIE